MTEKTEHQTILDASSNINGSRSEHNPVFGIVVGEHSGDTLGAGLMSSLMPEFQKKRQANLSVLLTSIAAIVKGNSIL